MIDIIFANSGVVVYEPIYRDGALHGLATKQETRERRILQYVARNDANGWIVDVTGSRGVETFRGATHNLALEVAAAVGRAL